MLNPIPPLPYPYSNVYIIDTMILCWTLTTRPPTPTLMYML